MISTVTWALLTSGLDRYDTWAPAGVAAGKGEPVPRWGRGEIPMRARARRPRLLGGKLPDPVRAGVLLLPGGFLVSHLKPRAITDLGLAGPRWQLARHAGDGLAVRLLRYRYWGWNGAHADTASDARWALDELASRFPDVPVVLVGNSLGGRAAVEVADHPAVAGVACLAPWLPAEQPVTPLAGRPVLIIHGAVDRSQAPADWSRDFAARARTAGVSVARFIVPRAGHLLLRRHSDWAALTTAFTLAAAGLAPMPAEVVQAADPAADLSLPLPAMATAVG